MWPCRWMRAEHIVASRKKMISERAFERRCSVTKDNVFRHVLLLRKDGTDGKHLEFTSARRNTSPLKVSLQRVAFRLRSEFEMLTDPPKMARKHSERKSLRFAPRIGPSAFLR